MQNMFQGALLLEIYCSLNLFLPPLLMRLYLDFVLAASWWQLLALVRRQIVQKRLDSRSISTALGRLGLLIIRTWQERPDVGNQALFDSVPLGRSPWLVFWSCISTSCIVLIRLVILEGRGPFAQQ